MRQMTSAVLISFSPDAHEAGTKPAEIPRKVKVQELSYRGERWKVIRADPYKEWNGVILAIRRKAGNSGSVVGRYE